jgi:hypothetical protein
MDSNGTGPSVELRAWDADVRSLLREMEDGFLEKYGFPAHGNFVAGPTDSPQMASLADLPKGRAREQLAELYQVTSEVSLNNFRNGLFLHPLSHVANMHKSGELVRVSGNYDAEVIAFGSDGGGVLFAIDVSGSPVYRLPNAMIADGVYSSMDDDFMIIASDVQGFLGEVRKDLEIFARSGDIRPDSRLWG